ncbi:MAG: deoxynucleoside kinase [Azoarcus sp.]|jgi:deoxyadenosine/deoxycytidine kinase|nr:deoxynucleoside kinase [Azoarcus sp.]
MLEKVRYIAVEGPIGAGKTSLAQRLAAYLPGVKPVFEQPQDNPFLTRFYQNPERWALATQLFFLLQRFEQLSVLAHEGLGESQCIVTDFMLERDPLFARLNLAPDELALYEKIYAAMKPPSLPVPDLVIYLQAPVTALAERVHKRGIDAERRITESYLEKVARHYSDFFFRYETSPLFVVDAAVLNPVDNENDFKLLIERLKEMRGHREFFGYAA